MTKSKFLKEYSVKLRIVENVVIEFRNRPFKDLKFMICSNFIQNVIGSVRSDLCF